MKEYSSERKKKEILELKARMVNEYCDIIGDITSCSTRRRLNPLCELIENYIEMAEEELIKAGATHERIRIFKDNYETVWNGLTKDCKHVNIRIAEFYQLRADQLARNLLEF